MTISLILLVIAFVAFVVAAVGYSPPRVNMIALGLALWLLGTLVAGKA